MYDAYWSAKGARGTSGPGIMGQLGGAIFAGAVVGATAGTFIAGPFGTAAGAIAGIGIGLAVAAGTLAYHNWDTIKAWLVYDDTRLISQYDFRRPVVNTRLAATMRQAGMQSIMSTAQNYRQYLGKEAAQLHM